VLAVDDSGTLSALDAATGDVRWRHRERGYVGSPAMVGTDAIVASADGRVHVIDASGNVVATIETQDARGGAPAGFDYGPTVGGGKLWLADKTGTVWRLGPAAQGSSQLAAAWLHASVDAPFAAFPFVSSAVAWRDSAVVLDTRRHSFFIDPTSGTTTAGPVVGKDGDVLLADPVVAGDTLLIDAGSRLLAVDLPSGAERWSQPLVGTRYLPPAVQGNTVVTISDDPNGTQIQAFALDSGQLLWTAPTTPAATKGQPLIGDGVVFAGSPVAGYDLATGAPRWTSTVENPSGGMARSSDGRMLFVATLPPNAADGQLIAVNVADGALAWSATTTGQGLLPLSRLIDLGQTIVLSSFNGSAHGYDAGNGTELWHKEFPSSVLGGPAAIGERAWFALQSGQVAVLDATGTVTASFQGFGTSINAISVAQHPAEVGGVVVIPGGSTIFGVKEAS
jgi:outer membrane protein assembly factor BamB